MKLMLYELNNEANKSAHMVDDKDCKESVNSLHFNDV